MRTYTCMCVHTHIHTHTLTHTHTHTHIHTHTHTHTETPRPQWQKFYSISSSKSLPVCCMYTTVQQLSSPVKIRDSSKLSLTQDSAVLNSLHSQRSPCKLSWCCNPTFDLSPRIYSPDLDVSLSHGIKGKNLTTCKMRTHPHATSWQGRKQSHVHINKEAMPVPFTE